MSARPRPPTDEVSTEIYIAQQKAPATSRTTRPTQRGVEARRNGERPHSLDEIDSTDFMHPSERVVEQRDTLRDIPSRGQLALGSVDPDHRDTAPDADSGDITADRSTDVTVKDIVAAPRAARRTAQGPGTATTRPGRPLAHRDAHTSPPRAKSLPAEIAAHAKKLELSSGASHPELEVRDTVRDIPQGRVVHGTLQPMPRRQLDTPAPGSSAAPTVVSSVAAPVAPMVASKSEPLRVISMKVRDSDAPQRKELEVKEHKIVLRPPESMGPRNSTPPGGMGFLAPPRDEKAARVRDVRELVTWGCVVVMVGCLVTLVVWLLAR